MQKFAFVCTNYNNSHHSRLFVSTLVNSKFYNSELYKIVIVDNKSTDTEIDYLRKIKEDFSDIIILFQNVNLGYFAGLNIGIQHIRTNYEGFDNCLVGNNDLFFSPIFLKQLQENTGTLNSYPVVSPDILRVDHVHQNPHVLNGVSPLKEIILDLYYSNYYLGKGMMFFNNLLRKVIKKRPPDHNFEGEIFQGYGACYFLSELFFNHYNLLDAPTFLMGEEMFLTLQVNKLGYNIYYTNKITVYHVDHASINKLPSRSFWNISANAHKVYRANVPHINNSKKIFR